MIGGCGHTANDKKGIFLHFILYFNDTRLFNFDRASENISYTFRVPYNELVSMKEMITKYVRKVDLLSCSVRHPEDIL